MIKVLDKSKCCGCEACVQICPKHCISFNADEEGFRYPVVASDLCIDCGLCEKACPVINKKDKRVPIQSFAAKNPCESERLRSSSGGIFIVLAKEVLNQGGVVFGARFDESWNVVHSYTDSVDGIEPFLGSKYVQSRIGDSYVKAKEFLLTGRKVLFSGTPCQIAGLRLYLRKEFENLITVDLICHGVPSPGIWQQYLSEILTQQDNATIESITFRDKSSGWKNYRFIVTLSKFLSAGKKQTFRVSHLHDEDPFFQGFNDYNLILRPSCMKCPSRNLRSGSDITLADFWGIETLIPEFDDDKGVSVIMVNTESGLKMVNSLCIESHPVKYDDIVSRNSSIMIDSLPQKSSFVDVIKYRTRLKTRRDYFFYKSKYSVIKRVQLFGKITLEQKLYFILLRIYHKLI